MKTRTMLLLPLVALLTLPPVAHAQSQSKAPAKSSAHAAPAKRAALTYECPICHHRVNASLAKKVHYTCPVDGGKLTLVKTAGLRKPHG